MVKFNHFWYYNYCNFIPRWGCRPETTEAIKFSAPKFYSAFGRAVSTRDYEAIIPQIYPNVGSIACYGGEEAEPPEFGKVFLAIKPKNADKLSLSEKNVCFEEVERVFCCSNSTNNH